MENILYQEKFKKGRSQRSFKARELHRTNFTTEYSINTDARKTKSVGRTWEVEMPDQLRKTAQIDRNGPQAAENYKDKCYRYVRL